MTNTKIKYEISTKNTLYPNFQAWDDNLANQAASHETSCSPQKLENLKNVAYLSKSRLLTFNEAIIDFWLAEPFNATSRVCKYPDEEDHETQTKIERNCANYKAVHDDGMFSWYVKLMRKIPCNLYQCKLDYFCLNDKNILIHSHDFVLY